MNEVTINEGLLKDTADAIVTYILLNSLIKIVIHIVIYVLLEDMKYRGLETRVSNALIRELDEYVEKRLKGLISYARVIE